MSSIGRKATSGTASSVAFTPVQVQSFVFRCSCSREFWPELHLYENLYRFHSLQIRYDLFHWLLLLQPQSLLLHAWPIYSLIYISSNLSWRNFDHFRVLRLWTRWRRRRRWTRPTQSISQQPRDSGIVAQFNNWYWYLQQHWLIGEFYVLNNVFIWFFGVWLSKL